MVTQFRANKEQLAANSKQLKDMSHELSVVKDRRGIETACIAQTQPNSANRIPSKHLETFLFCCMLLHPSCTDNGAASDLTELLTDCC